MELGSLYSRAKMNFAFKVVLHSTTQGTSEVRNSYKLDARTIELPHCDKVVAKLIKGIKSDRNGVAIEGWHVLTCYKRHCTSKPFALHWVGNPCIRSTGARVNSSDRQKSALLRECSVRQAAIKRVNDAALVVSLAGSYETGMMMNQYSVN